MDSLSLLGSPSDISRPSEGHMLAAAGRLCEFQGGEVAEQDFDYTGRKDQFRMPTGCWLVLLHRTSDPGSTSHVDFC